MIEAVLVIGRPVAAGKLLAAELQRINLFPSEEDKRRERICHRKAEIESSAGLVAFFHAQAGFIVGVFSVQGAGTDRPARIRRRYPGHQFAVGAVSIRQIVFSHQGILAQADGNGLVVAINVALGFSALDPQIQPVEWTPAQLSPGFIGRLLGDFLVIAIEFLAFDTAGKLNVLPDDIVATDSELRALEAVGCVCFVIVRDEAIDDDAIPACLQGRIVAFIVTVGHPDPSLRQRPR